MRGRVPPRAAPAQLDWSGPREQALGQKDRGQDPGLEVRQRQDPDPTHPAAVPGRKHAHVQDHCGNVVQVQEVLAPAQPIREQVPGGGSDYIAALPAQASGEEQEEAGEEEVHGQLARAVRARRKKVWMYELCH